MPIRAEITTNVQSVRHQMSLIPQAARVELKAWVTDLAVWAKEELKNKVPVKTGTLKNSIKYKTNYRGQDDIDVQFMWEWYGDVLDRGSTYSEMIYPKHAKAFRFTMGTSIVFAKYVTVPPIKARNWSMQVFDEAETKAMALAVRIESVLLGMVKNE